MRESRGRTTSSAALALLALGARIAPLAQAPPVPVAPTPLAATASAAPALAAPAAPPPPTPPAPPGAPRPFAELPYTPSLEPAFMDRSVDPCVDFYAYSCNGWRTQNPIPPDQSRWSVYGKLYNENQQFLWGLLEEAAREHRRRPIRSCASSATTSPPAWTRRDRQGRARSDPGRRAGDRPGSRTARRSPRSLGGLHARAQRARPALRLRHRAGSRRRHAADRRRRGRRARPSGPRLLPQDRRRVGRPAGEVRRARRAHLRAAGRARRTGPRRAPRSCSRSRPSSRRPRSRGSTGAIRTRSITG